MDVVGHADPYFIAKIDDQVSFTYVLLSLSRSRLHFSIISSSSIISNTATPKWENETWIVRHIPLNAKLTVKVYDKDDDQLSDDYIGQFEILNLINYHAPEKGHEIIGPFNHQNGYFHLSIQAKESSKESRELPPYTFDGPCRYSRHDSVAVGRLTMLNADCLYSTWKIQIRRIDVFFQLHQRQHWNKQYKAAQAIFGNYPLCLISQSTIKLAHKALYGRTLKHSENGQLKDADELWKMIFTDRTTQLIKPCIYTYVIDDYMWRFSETDGQFFADFASKHALLANCSEYVRYAGEFHPRPKYGWNRWEDEWELVFDNGSGTYSPDPELLTNLKELLTFNFPGLNIVTYDFNDPRLKSSLDDLKEALEKFHNSTSTIQQLVLNFPSPHPSDND